jgi:hypothetical protein
MTSVKCIYRTKQFRALSTGYDYCKYTRDMCGFYSCLSVHGNLREVIESLSNCHFTCQNQIQLHKHFLPIICKYMCLEKESST